MFASCVIACFSFSLFAHTFFVLSPFSSRSHIHGSPPPSNKEQKNKGTNLVRPIKSHLLEAPSFPPQSHYFIDLITNRKKNEQDVYW